MRLLSVKPSPTFGVLGVQTRRYKCDACGHEEDGELK